MSCFFVLFVIRFARRNQEFITFFFWLIKFDLKWLLKTDIPSFKKTTKKQNNMHIYFCSVLGYTLSIECLNCNHSIRQHSRVIVAERSESRRWKPIRFSTFGGHQGRFADHCGYLSRRINSSAREILGSRDQLRGKKNEEYLALHANCCHNSVIASIIPRAGKGEKA